MSAHALLHLSNKWGKRDKSLFHNKFNEFMNVRLYLLYDIKITLNSHFWHEMATILPYTCEFFFITVITQYPNHLWFIDLNILHYTTYVINMVYFFWGISTCMYSKTCVKQPLKNRQNKGFFDTWYLNDSQKYCKMLPLEHSAILLT